MNNPFRALKYLPWSALVLSAGLTVLIATAIDILLWYAIAAVPQLGNALLTSPILQIILFVGAFFGIGALSIVVTSRFFRQVLLQANTMWALIGCVLLLLWVKSISPGIPALFLRGLDSISLVAVVVGAFTYGKRYWR
ncbi:MAG: peptide chain release factor 1 [Phormidesmis priestleyi]|uniref:Peptide chain release factor 1 n=1 Tax=Phormidesmis priestleyi TaxID=268141 RepID=A0A2W4WPF1_9CYAN|nr:MAG: peptide chain release factor 1 [Phormidesmis priestleyi]